MAIRPLRYQMMQKRNDWRGSREHTLMLTQRQHQAVDMQTPWTGFKMHIELPTGQITGKNYSIFLLHHSWMTDRQGKKNKKPLPSTQIKLASNNSLPPTVKRRELHFALQGYTTHLEWEELLNLKIFLLLSGYSSYFDIISDNAVRVALNQRLLTKHELRK